MTGALAWFKSTYSSNAGGDCVEVAYNWRSPATAATRRMPA
ncbi:Hypothetical protein XNRR2_1296 [Streptomyces albidoflavus]|nr:Hypothetical protein XNR_1296 [Streptomyces albidoflavus]EFE84189.1 conserved hypothetical protein [Streptomyces albidoflavus]QLP91456.1 Hypothetical protein XNRR2_1296 [Streptomyces albidoflavus]WAE09913.1 Hypothetical protein SAD14_1296 [Streptomyces albidoflavus]WAE15554.1 Hypothetical protein SAD14N_1296 [Streptomyces albidoflavus]